MSSPTIFDLPFEDIIVPHLGVYLDNKDLLAMWKASRECKAFRDMVKGMIRARRHLRISSMPADEEFNRIAFRTCRKLRSIEINFVTKDPQGGSLVDLLANNSMISKIELSSVSWNWFFGAFYKSNILLHYLSVRVYYAGYSSTKKDMDDFIAKQVCLKKFKGLFYNARLDDIQLTLLTIAHNCHELEEIYISFHYYEKSQDDIFREILKNCPKLRTYKFCTINYDD